MFYFMLKVTGKKTQDKVIKENYIFLIVFKIYALKYISQLMQKKSCNLRIEILGNQDIFLL